MKFNERLLTILKNLSSINQTLVLNPGNEIKTMATGKNIFAIAKVDTTIPAKACIYDLGRFLNTLGLYTDVDVQFEKDHFLLSEGKRKAKYTYADESMILNESNKNINLPAAFLEVDITWDDLSSVLKAQGVLGLPDVTLTGADGVCTLRAVNMEVPTADIFSVEIGQTTDNFNVIFAPATLKLIQDDYKVSLCKGISQFKSNDMTYYITVDKRSTYQ